MESGALKNLYARVIYLAACTLADKCPDRETLGECDAEKLYLAAKRHNIGTLVAASLERLRLASDNMRIDTSRMIRKIMLLDAERGEIIRELESRGIRYMPLKGIIIKELYPKIGLREMTDNDILFDSEYRAAVRDVFRERGYSVSSYGKEKNHDAYVKAPVYNYEMHVSLFGSRMLGDAFLEYFDGAFERAVGDGLCYRMTNEDFYIYMKAHEYKHYVMSGVGLRLFADAAVFMSKYGDTLDFDYVSVVCEKIGIADFERVSASLAKKLFDLDTAAALCRGERVLSGEEEELFLYCSGSGAYGFISQNVQNELARFDDKSGKGRFLKTRYIWHRLFPPKEWYRTYSPFAYKHAFARPFVLVGRFFKTLFVAPRKLTVSFLAVVKYKDKKRK